MASAFGHAAFAAALGRFRRYGARSTKFWIAMIVCSILPDADVLAFRYGIPYGAPLGHRGFTHSILFAAIASILVTALFFSAGGRARLKFGREQWATAALLFMSFLSHGLLDAMTDGGLGVGFFIPFSNERFFFPFRPIRVSPISVTAFFDGRGWPVLKSEITWIGRFIFVIFFVQFIREKWRATRR